MNTKHTPAPWEADNTGFGKMQIWNAKEARMDFNDLHLIATIHSVEVKGDNQLKANAKLIAAAPELLEALKELVLVAKTFEILPSKWIDPLIKAENLLNKVNN